MARTKQFACPPSKSKPRKVKRNPPASISIPSTPEFHDVILHPDSPSPSTSNQSHPVPSPSLSNELNPISPDYIPPTPVYDQQQDTSTSLESTLPADYFFVERIDGVRVSNGQRLFRVKWAGYDETTWEREENLDGCVGLLNEFLGSQQLEPTVVKARAGASISSSTTNNPLNWKTAGEIINAISTFDNVNAYNYKIDVQEYHNGPVDSLSVKDSIYIITHYSHFYVMLLIPSQSRILIADGDNIYMKDAMVREELRTKFNSPFDVRPILYCQQTKVDHCGSSAVLIALEFKRIYKKMQVRGDSIPEEIRAPPSIRKRVVSSLHKHRSAMIADKSICISLFKPPRCDSCGKEFRGKSAGRALHGHKLRCGRKMKITSASQ